VRQSVVAEIVGPAGAGKSTLAHVLRERDDTLRAGLSVWGLPVSLLFLNSFLALPKVFGLCRSRRRVRWDEVKLIIRLNALHQLLGRESAKNYKTLLLDEGTIFALVKLLTFSNEAGSHGRFNKWTESLLDRWAGRLDAVIWLDAPDAVLAERIRARGKAHRVKDKSDEEIYEFLAHYRRSYESVLSKLSARHNLKLIRFSTERESLDEIAEKVLAGVGKGI
jgi:shikimate kinase